jgi:hypothetical protein
MWDLLKQTDIEQAKQELKLRRSETLRRHAEESQILDAAQAELETLNRLVDAFAQKFLKFETLLQAPTPVAVSHKNLNYETSADVRHQKHSNQSPTNFAQTNFDTFARAVARG